MSRGRTDCTLSKIKTDLRDTEPPLWVDTAVKLHTFQQDDHHTAKPILAHICPVWRMSDLLENHIYQNCHELGDLINLGQSVLAHYQKLSVLFSCGLSYELRTVDSDVYAVSQYMYMLTNHMYIPTLEKLRGILTMD